jgi:hypothetical protein
LDVEAIQIDMSNHSKLLRFRPSHWHFDLIFYYENAFWIRARGVGRVEIRFLPGRSVSLSKGNVVLADPARIWPDPDPKRGSADPVSRPRGSGNIGNVPKQIYQELSGLLIFFLWYFNKQFVVFAFLVALG